MSEEKNITGDNQLVSFEQAAEFFAKRAQNPCPACGNNSWTLNASTKIGEDYVSLGFSLMNQHDGNMYLKGIPLIVATCKKCGFVRPHNLKIISKWIADGKPEFSE